MRTSIFLTSVFLLTAIDVQSGDDKKGANKLRLRQGHDAVGHFQG